MIMTPRRVWAVYFPVSSFCPDLFCYHERLGGFFFYFSSDIFAWPCRGTVVLEHRMCGRTGQRPGKPVYLTPWRPTPAVNETVTSVYTFAVLGSDAASESLWSLFPLSMLRGWHVALATISQFLASACVLISILVQSCRLASSPDRGHNTLPWKVPAVVSMSCIDLC